MMQTFRTEGNYRSADRLSPAELRAAFASRGNFTEHCPCL